MATIGELAPTRPDHVPPELYWNHYWEVFASQEGDPFRHVGSLHDGPEIFFARDIVSPAFVRTMIAEHESRRRNNTTWLWSLLMLEMWFRRQEAPRDAGAPEPVCR